MPLDALCLSGLVRELDQTVTGGKIDKIYQPGRDEVILALRTPAQGNVRLLLSANPSHPRPQLTQLTRENPDTPPMFCMLLRKHLSGARILSVAQPPLERVVTLTLEAMNELGDRVERRLVLEAIGRRSLYIFCIHTVELTAIPWYLFAAKYADRPVLGICLQYVLSLGSIWLVCALLQRRRDLVIKLFPARRHTPQVLYTPRH